MTAGSSSIFRRVLTPSACSRDRRPAGSLPRSMRPVKRFVEERLAFPEHGTFIEQAINHGTDVEDSKIGIQDPTLPDHLLTREIRHLQIGDQKINLSSVL